MTGPPPDTATGAGQQPPPGSFAGQQSAQPQWPAWPVFRPAQGWPQAPGQTVPPPPGQTVPPPPGYPLTQPPGQPGHLPVGQPVPPAVGLPPPPAGYVWPQAGAGHPIPPGHGWPPSPGQPMPYQVGPGGFPPRAFTTHPFPTAHAAVGHPKVRLSHTKLIVVLVTIIAAVVIGIVALAAAAPTATPATCKLQLCTEPPTGPPVVNGHQYTSATFGFSLVYGDASGVSTSADGVQLGFAFKGSSGTDTLVVAGRKANGADAQAVVQSVESSQFPNAVAAYTLPGAYVGYQLGYGVAFDVWSNNANGSQSDQRVILMAAVRGNLAVVVLAFGPKLVLTPQNGFVSHPTGADLPAATVADPIVNSITWPSG
jgi:hypothetical protein